MSEDLKNTTTNKYRTTFIPRLSRLHSLFLLAILFSASFLMLYRCIYKERTEFNRRQIIQNHSLWDNHDSRYFKERFAINTEGCSIPAFNPLDEAVKKYVFYPTVKPCRNSSFPLLDNNRTHIWIKEDNRKHYYGTGSDNISCCYKSFHRPIKVDDITSTRVDDRVQYSKCISFSKTTKVNDEFVKIECKNNSKMIYNQFFSFTPKKKFSYKDIKEISKSKSAYNVLVLGIDNVSRLNFRRTMPKTYQFLKNKGAVELLGYNKVGDNSYPNVIPMLIGTKHTEIRNMCLPNIWSTFDNCPFIWDWYKQAGYYTAFGEDTAILGTFNYLMSGFIGTPTDYYLHTFISEAANNVGNNKDFNTFLCMNEKYFYDVLLNYIEDLIATLQYTKLFGFFWEVTMSHDYLNYPMVMDTSYERFLHKLNDSKYLDETIILLVSDHGIRWGDIRSTKQGRFEERLPFVHMLVPPSFRNKYSEAYTNLVLNSQRLTTPFDVHATLYDLVNLENIKNEQIQVRKLRSYWKDRSISLFLPIPRNRTCQLADIDDHWCTCQRSHKLSLKSEEALKATSQLLRHLNELLTPHRQCAPLILAEIIEVLEVEHKTLDQNEVLNGVREFMVVIRTNPGGAILEGTLYYNNRDWSLAGTVSRLNLYGDQSQCMSNRQLKLYCFCI